MEWVASSSRQAVDWVGASASGEFGRAGVKRLVSIDLARLWGGV